MIKLQHGLLLITLIFTNSYLFGYTWPSTDSLVLSTFGQQDNFLQVNKGLRLSTVSGVAAIADGEIIFYQTKDSLLPSRNLGSIVIAHEDSMQSIYTNIYSISENYRVTMGEPIYQTTGGSHQYQLFLYDLRLRRYVNPMLFLPLGRAGNNVWIERVVAVNQSGEIFPITNGARIPSGLMDIYVTSYVFASGGRRLNPQEFTLQILGNTVAHLGMNAIMEENGRAYLVANRALVIDEMYNHDNMMHLTQVRLNEGQPNIVLRVTNIDGFVRENAMRIQVVEG